jgi:hypothetical protein
MGMGRRRKKKKKKTGYSRCECVDVLTGGCEGQHHHKPGDGC